MWDDWGSLQHDKELTQGWFFAPYWPEYMKKSPFRKSWVRLCSVPWGRAGWVWSWRRSEEAPADESEAGRAPPALSTDLAMQTKMTARSESAGRGRAASRPHPGASAVHTAPIWQGALLRYLTGVWLEAFSNPESEQHANAYQYQYHSTLTQLMISVNRLFTPLISLIFTVESTLTRLIWVSIESNLTHDSWVERNVAWKKISMP